MRLLGWVIMPEHFHMLVIPELPQWTMPKVLQAIKGPFAQRVIGRWRQLNAPIIDRLMDWNGNVRFWQRGGGYDRNICDEGERLEKLNYIHNNPVTRGLVANPLEWLWSSARTYAGDADSLLPVDAIT